MNLPFSKEAFLQVFSQYNTSIFPLQLVLNFVALLTILIILKKQKDAARVVPALLAMLWFWTGAIYHFTFFTSINPAAYGFAFLCIIQAIIFVWLAVSGKVDFRYPNGLRGIVGSIVVIYALLIYPVIGHFLGHSYPNSPTFGAPCPTTIFTFGILLWSNKLPKYSLIIPIIWALIGFTAAFTMGIWEDTALPISAFASIFLLMSEKRTDQKKQ